MDLVEAGDVSANHNDKFRRSSIVDKLLAISETCDQLPYNFKILNDSISGWHPFINPPLVAPKKTKMDGSNNAPNNKKQYNAQGQAKEKTKDKRNIFLKEILPLRLKNVANPFRDMDSKRAIKFGMRRLEELAAPKNVRKKVELESYKRHEMPVKRTVSLDDSPPMSPDDIKESSERCFTSPLLNSEKEEIILFRNFLKKIPKFEKQLLNDPLILGTSLNQNKKSQNDVAHIALHYGTGGPELRKKSKSVSNSASKKSLTPVVRSPRDPFTEKLQGISAYKDKKADLTPVLTKRKHKNSNNSATQVNTSSQKKRTKSKIMPDLPMPHANIAHFKQDKIKHTKPKNIVNEVQMYNWRFNSLLPVDYQTNKTTGTKNIYYKKSLGSVTAITEGNIKAGINTHSIGKLQRKPMPGRIDRPIIPKMTGTHAEVPLLPLSPDFLRKFA